MLAYNIPGVTNLVLTRQQIVGIYNGSINNWNDTTFAEHNPGVQLPNATIIPVARLGSSGSTEIFTKALSSFSEAWASQYGVFSKPTGWNATVVRLFAQRSSGMVDSIRQVPYRIGYVTPDSAVEVNLPFALIINRHGSISVADKRSLQAAMDERSHSMSSRLTGNLVDCACNETYPIADYSYFVVHMIQEGNCSVADREVFEVACSVAVELARYVEWFLTSSQADADAAKSHLVSPVSPSSDWLLTRSQADADAAKSHLVSPVSPSSDVFLTRSQAEAEAEDRFMAPVSRGVANKIRSAVLERMTCDGQLLMDLVRRQKFEEDESLKTWKLPVQIVSPLIAVIILTLIAYAVQQKLKYLRVLNRDDWKINYFEIEFCVTKKRRWTVRSAGEPVPALSDNFAGYWNNHEVVTRPLTIAHVFHVNWKVKQTLMRMREEIGHENVARFFGISSHNNAIYLVEQHCANGTVVDFFRDNKFSVNQSFRYIVCADIANGMAYLHRQNLIHGNLSIDKCHVDARWTIKIVDWEYTALYNVIRRTDCKQAQAARDKTVLQFIYSQGSRAFRHLAPEIQKNGHLFEPTRAGDVYSFGIIILDLFTNSSGHELPLPLTTYTVPPKARQIMELACCETAIKRPTFMQLEKSMRSAISGGKTNLLDRCVNRGIFIKPQGNRPRSSYGLL